MSTFSIQRTSVWTVIHPFLYEGEVVRFGTCSVADLGVVGGHSFLREVSDDYARWEAYVVAKQIAAAEDTDNRATIARLWGSSADSS